MQFPSKVDIAAPVAFVFSALANFEGWERAALRRGADVSRTDSLRAPGPGMGWHVQFRFRRRERKLDLKLTAMNPPNNLVFTGGGKLLTGDLALDVVALSASRTRLVMALEVRALTLGARLMLQSLKLARGRVDKRLAQRMTQLASNIEARYAASRAK